MSHFLADSFHALCSLFLVLAIPSIGLELYKDIKREFGKK